MTHSHPPSPSPTLPDTAVRYPFKIGRSLRNPRTARDFLALKYMHIPDKVSMSQPATLRREQDTCQVQMPTTDGHSSVMFEGHCRTPNPRRESAVGDYMLVFVNGQMWLERASDYFQNVRATDGARNEGPKMEYPEGVGQEEEDEAMRDGDSWMAGGGDDDEEGGSPITPEEDSVMGEEGMVGRVGGKGVGGMGGGSGSVGQGRVVSGRVGLKSVAGKSVAGKGPSSVRGSAGRRRGREDVDNEEDGGSSSEDDEDDSDDSESDSDSDGSFTEESSEED